MKLVLDTCAYSELARGNEAVLEVYGQADVVYVPFAVIGELIAGFRKGRHFRRNMSQLSRFLEIARVQRVDSTGRTTDFYGRIHAQLRRAGTPIPINDVWIAAQVLEHGAVLATFDRHFQTIAGLPLWDPDQG